MLADGSRIAVDAVIAATGFRPALEGLVGHLGLLDAAGRPLVHGADTHPAAPGLYFAALSPTLSGLLRSAAADARRVASAVARD